MSLDGLIGFGVGVAVGLAAGLALRVWWGRDAAGKPRVNVALVNNWQRAFFAVVSVLALGSVVLTARTNDAEREQTERLHEITTQQQQTVARQTYCNRELIRVININTDINTENAQLLDELLAAVGEQVTSGARDREAVAKAFDRYMTAKAKNAADRQPYPPPDCGE